MGTPLVPTIFIEKETFMASIIIYVTFPDRDTAEDISQMLVADRLVACANILPAVSSLYRWEGAVQSAEEVVVIYKTQAALYEKVESKIRRLHPYDTPCIVSWELTRGAPAFLQWVEGALKK